MSTYTFALILAISSFLCFWLGLRAVAVKTMYNNDAIDSITYHRHMEILYRVLVSSICGTVCAVVVLDIKYDLTNKFFAAMSTRFL